MRSVLLKVLFLWRKKSSERSKRGFPEGNIFALMIFVHFFFSSLVQTRLEWYIHPQQCLKTFLICNSTGHMDEGSKE